MNADFLFSLRKLLHWLFAFLAALLPQHLIAQLGDADLPVAVYVTTADAPRPPPVEHLATDEAPAAQPPDGTEAGAAHGASQSAN